MNVKKIIKELSDSVLWQVLHTLHISSVKAMARSTSVLCEKYGDDEDDIEIDDDEDDEFRFYDNMIEPDDECLAPNKEKKPSFSVSIHNFAPLDSVKVEGISEKDMDILIYHISHDKYTSNKQIREWLEVDKDTAAKVIYALRKAGYIGDEYSNYMIPVNITTEVYFRLRSYNNSTK